MPPLTLVFLRVTIAAAVLLVVLRVTGRPWPFERRTIIPFLTLALLNNIVPFCLFAWGQQQIASGLASILNATTPLWAVLVAHFLTADEKATPLKVAGVAIGFAGVALMIGGDFLLDIGGAGLLAQLACLVATLSYALAGVHARRFRMMGVSPMGVSAGTLGAAVPVMLVLVLLFEPTSLGTIPPAEAIASILALGPFFDGARLHPLFPADRERRRHQRHPRHLPHPGHRDPARRDPAPTKCWRRAISSAWP